MGFLTDIVAEVRRDLDRSPPDGRALRERVEGAPPARDLAGALRARRPAVIAEVKRASPSAGEIAERDAASQARAYEAGGAVAVSVLTEPRHFHGSLADLRETRAAIRLPVLRKDFVVHPLQLLESRAAGADAVLLIAASVTPSELAELRSATEELGMQALVEAHSELDLELALDSGAELVGVNARDLETLEVDVERALAMLREVPADRVAVLESGVSDRRQVERAVEAGAGALLVGEALMRAADPVAKLRELLGVDAA